MPVHNSSVAKTRRIAPAAPFGAIEIAKILFDTVDTAVASNIFELHVDSSTSPLHSRLYSFSSKTYESNKRRLASDYSAQIPYKLTGEDNMSTAQARKEMVAVDAPRPTSPCSSTAPPSRSMRHKGKPSLQAFLAAAVIAMLCLQIPVASAGDMIDLLHTKSSAAATAAAADNPDYVSSLGLSCAEHSELRCDKMGALGYDGFEVDELLQSCPESCATSSQKGTYRRLNNNDDDDERLTGVHRLLNLSYTADNNRNADQTCFDGCQDDTGYLSKIGMRCERFEMFKCRQFAEVGFTLEETDELVNSCPCACKEECR